jgi:CBS-domain-containing membrane protein
MRKNDPIKHIMSTDTHTVQQGQAISEVAKLLQQHSFHHIPVLDGRKLVGIVTSSDLMKLSVGAQGYDSNQHWSFLDSQYELIDVMTPNPKTLQESDVVRDAAIALSTGTLHSLPVVDSSHELVGIVTSTDLINYLLEQY